VIDYKFTTRKVPSEVKNRSNNIYRDEFVMIWLIIKKLYESALGKFMYVNEMKSSVAGIYFNCYVASRESIISAHENIILKVIHWNCEIRIL
jgi:hypothetical protein